MNEQMNIGVVGIGKMGILHTGILSSLDGVNLDREVVTRTGDISDGTK